MQWGSEVCSALGWLDPAFPDHLMGGQGHLTHCQDTNERGPLTCLERKIILALPGRQDTPPSAAKVMPGDWPSG